MGDRAKHTAGPWHPSLPIQINWTYEVDGCDAQVFCPGNAYPWVMANIQGPDRKQTEAYARLIAAAPDLLDALREARETILQLKNSRWSECEGSDAEWVGGLDVAISRATGEA